MAKAERCLEQLDVRLLDLEREWAETVERVCPYRKPPLFKTIPVLMDRCGFTGRLCCYKDCPAVKMKRRR